MASEHKFRPFPFIRGFHGQTILGSLLNFTLGLSSETECIELPDHDKLALEVTTPKRWKPHKPTVVLVHGLCGSHRSPYMVRMVKRIIRKGMKAVRMNMRGCGTGRGLARNFYHCGSSPDVISVVKHLKETNPDSPIILIGFSLGGHLVLKSAGELGQNAQGLLEKVIAVSPPINLVSSMRLLSHPKNRMYERYFLRHLLDTLYDFHTLFPEIPRVKLPQELSVFELDELYIAPRLGYKSAFEYYKSNSSMLVIPNISVTTKILLSLDDPIIDPDDIDTIKVPECVEVVKTENGGHLGYLGVPGDEHGIRWLDSMLIRWIKSTE